MPIYCLVPQDLADELHDPLHAHFRRDRSVMVVVDRRWREGRANGDRGRAAAPARPELMEVSPPPLPRVARAHAERLRFVQRLERPGREAEDEDTNELVAWAQSGDREAFAALYLRYFDRVYGYLRMSLRDRDEAEDLTQQVFLKALDHLDTYEVAPHRSFRPWLFRIARNLLIDHVKKHRPTLLDDPDQMPRRPASGPADVATVESTLAWMSDSEVTLFIERLPLPQRQVITLRYLIGLSLEEIADVLGRSPGSIRMLDLRARQYLQERLTALGRKPSVARRRAMRSLWRQMHVLRERRFALRQ
ncbi:MAG TPA: sigma-70 family RNA polymerase sigma factor [Solirubrobacteraceae bacterium]|nr:sigma-70 family RNA polymerase sigma factor [Solirubrobacteraceae bacterium]